MKRASFNIVTFLAAAGVTLLATAQTPIAVRYTATTDNVGLSDSIRVELFRWSTDKERDQLLDAWKPPAPPAVTAVVPPPPPPPEPVAAAPDTDADNAAAAPAARGGRGGNARGGAAGRGAAGNARGGAAAPRGGAPARGGAARGGGRGDAAAAPAAPRTPEDSLAEALRRLETVGRIWSSEAAGYSIRYALRLPQPDGGERVVLITDRRLNPDIWKPTSGVATNYEFTVLEARLNPKGAGEARASLTGKVTFDSAAGTLALENYAAAPIILKNFERR